SSVRRRRLLALLDGVHPSPSGLRLVLGLAGDALGPLGGLVGGLPGGRRRLVGQCAGVAELLPGLLDRLLGASLCLLGALLRPLQVGVGVGLDGVDVLSRDLFSAGLLRRYVGVGLP